MIKRILAIFLDAFLPKIGFTDLFDYLDALN